MNQIIATAQQILDFKVGAISVGSVIQGLILLIIFNRIISMIMGPLIDKILDRFKLETTVRGFVKALVKVILNFVALCVVAESIGIPIASVLAVVGMLGLAISLSVQGALSNVSNGFLILVTKPFKVGDYVAIAGIEGFAIEIIDEPGLPIFFRSDWMQSRGYKPDSLYAIKVRGSSMEKTLYAGDVIVINTADREEKDDEVFVINCSGEVVVKRLMHRGGAWIMHSDNEDQNRYPPVPCDENCFIIGHVIYRQSDRI